MSNKPIPLRYNDDLTEYADTAFQVLAHQISTNYLKYIKTRIIPELGDFSDAPLRELRTLATIAHFADPIKGSRISRLLSYDPATVTRSTRWLIDQGLIEAQVNPNDARSIVYGLTAKGNELSDRYRELSRRAVIELNQIDSDRPDRQDILKAVAVLEKVRDRSQYAARMGENYRRTQKAAAKKNKS